MKEVAGAGPLYPVLNAGALGTPYPLLIAGALGTPYPLLIGGALGTPYPLDGLGGYCMNYLKTTLEAIRPGVGGFI